MSIQEDIIHLAGTAGCGGKAARVMEYMLAGEGTDETYSAILRAIASREQSDGELEAMLGTIRGFMVSVEWNGDSAIDVCGTGGDGLGTFNVSTAAAFVAAASGTTVAKHGNRSSSGSSGSAEIFQGLGVDIMACPVEQMLDICRICFMFAPRYHKAARHVAAARRTLGMRTIFNTLGPLCNPAGVRRQLVGVSDADMVGRMPRILAGCGAERVICVMSAEGADELLPVSNNAVCSYVDGRYHTSTVRPEDVGAHQARMSDILLDGRDPLTVFAGAVCGRTNVGAVHTVAMNAGAGLYAAGLAEDIREGFGDALESIESGSAEKLLHQFTKRYGNATILEDMT